MVVCLVEDFPDCCREKIDQLRASGNFSPEEVGDEESDSDAFWTLISSSPHAHLIDSIYKSYTDVSAFFTANLHPLIYNEHSEGGVGRHRVKPLGTRRD
jgi:hypothetical protein